MGYDDALDVVSIHGVGGIVGVLMGLRVSSEDEATGVDLSRHNERAHS